MTNFSKKFLWLLIILVIVGGIVFFLKKGTEPKETPTIRLGLSTVPYVSLAKVAYDKGFFTDEGLKVEVKEFTGGKFALQALIGGSLDLAAPAEFPITLAIANGEKLSMISEIARKGTQSASSMILRKEGNSFDAQTYFAKKRKIATSVGADAEFFAAEFFKKYNIKPSQYEIVSMNPGDMPIALANGSVDGVAIYEPFAYFARQRTGFDKVFNINDPSLYAATMVLIARPDWAIQNEKNITKFLRALKKAQDFIKDNPEESMDIISSFTKLDKEVLRSFWNSLIFELRLNNNLIKTMNDQAEWAKDTGKVPKETATPNFREFIFEAPLKKVVPSAIEL